MEKQSEKCNYCNGTGKEICKCCSGIGIHINLNVFYMFGFPIPNVIPCYNCNGTGRSKCIYCNGAGKENKIRY